MRALIAFGTQANPTIDPDLGGLGIALLTVLGIADGFQIPDPESHGNGNGETLVLDVGCEPSLAYARLVGDGSAGKPAAMSVVGSGLIPLETDLEADYPGANLGQPENQSCASGAAKIRGRVNKVRPKQALADASGSSQKKVAPANTQRAHFTPHRP